MGRSCDLDADERTGTEARQGTIQCTEGCTVHANQNKPTGKQTPPKQQIGRRASGGKLPPLASRSRTYFLLTKVLMIIPISMPIPMPMKGRPAAPVDHPLYVWQTLACAELEPQSSRRSKRTHLSWTNTMGKAPNIRYKVPYTLQCRPSVKQHCRWKAQGRSQGSTAPNDMSAYA